MRKQFHFQQIVLTKISLLAVLLFAQIIHLAELQTRQTLKDESWQKTQKLPKCQNRNQQITNYQRQSRSKKISNYKLPKYKFSLADFLRGSSMGLTPTKKANTVGASISQIRWESLAFFQRKYTQILDKYYTNTNTTQIQIQIRRLVSASSPK